MQPFQVTTDLLNSDNLKVAITQLWNDLKFCNFTMLKLMQKVGEYLFLYLGFTSFSTLYKSYHDS